MIAEDGDTVQGPLPKWPPYVVAGVTFLAMIIVFSVVAEIAVKVAVQRGVIAPPSPADYPAVLDVVFGSPARKLAVSVAINSLLVGAVAMAAAAYQPPGGRGIHRRLRLGLPGPWHVGVAVLGLIGLTTALDAAVGLAGLRDVGSLAQIRNALAPLSTAQQLAFAVLIGVGPGVSEELFFRGYMLNRISAAQGAVVAVVASSLTFGLFHADAVHTPVAAVMGVYLGLCLIYSGSVWVPIAAHVFNNAMATLTLDLAPSPAQAALLIPLGLTGGVSAIILLRRSQPAATIAR